MIPEKFAATIAQEVQVSPGQVANVLQLFDDGATIPFVARYRKDVTGGLDEVKLETIAERGAYFSALVDRRDAILTAIEKLDKLTPDLRRAIEDCTSRSQLEDLYLPYKKRQRTKATVAREKGLAPLADYLLGQEPGEQSIEEFAATFARAEKALASAEEALEGARHIIAERISLDAGARAKLRDKMRREGQIAAHPTKNAEGKKTKYEAYYDFKEPAAQIPSHRFLAIHRGAKEGVLRMELQVNDDDLIGLLLEDYLKAPGTPFEAIIREVAADAYHRLLRPSIENEVLGEVRERADEEAIRVFRENARNLLLAPPAGRLVVLGVDPGMKTGCKLAVVGPTGDYLESATVYPTPPREDVETAEQVLIELVKRHQVNAIAIGNGTGSRETARFVRGALAKVKDSGAFSVLVNEAGASVYSTSKVAREEFPDLDPTIRSAVAIARRLQDPLAELVKIEPRHIGVGQYQHDINQKRLREGLRQTVVYCVNRVGVDLNSASVSLLAYVSALNSAAARSIVERRNTQGAFQNRHQLMEVDGVGPKTFEQCAGFLRIAEGDNILDNTGIHPEAYPVVEQIAETLQLTPSKLVEDPSVLDQIDLSKFKTGVIGDQTLADLRLELSKPGRDPRTQFRVPKFLEGVDSVENLETGMECEGVVTNVTDFGAFVDIGVHQDGLVHLSELAHHFVADPRTVVRVGEIVRIKVIGVDKDLPRISLSIKALQPKPERSPRRNRGRGKSNEAQKTQTAPRDKDKQPASRRTQDTRDTARERRKPRGGRKPQGRPDNRRQETGKRSESGAPLNTQLADQLAKLREKLPSGE